MTKEELELEHGYVHQEQSDGVLQLQSISPDEPVQFCCSGCDSALLPLEQLCFYFQGARALHLTVKHECAEATRPCFHIGPQMIPKRVKFSPFVLNCPQCGVQVGSEVMCGPQRETVFCFPPLSVYFRCSLVGKYQKSWATMMAMLPLIARRSTETFYMGANSEDDLLGVRLQSLPKTTTNRPDIGTVALTLAALIDDLPLALKPRAYQLECTVAACTSPTHSAIVYLPTGAGKTLVAVLTMALLKHRNAQKLLIFLVERVPLVFQQGQYLAQHLGLSVLMACGEQNNDAGERELYSYDILCCTAQLLLNFLQRRILRLEDVSLVVFDEIHHAHKRHPYSLILENHLASMSTLYRPQILGLTASPTHGTSAVDISSKLEALQRLALNAVFFTPLIYRDDLEQNVSRPAMGFVTVETTPDDARLLILVFNFGQDVLGRIVDLLALDPELFRLSVDDNFFKTSIDALNRSLARKLIDLAFKSKNALANEVASFLLQLLNCQEMVSVLGCATAKQYLQDILKPVMSPDKTSLWSREERHRLQAFASSIQAFQVSRSSGKALYLMELLRELAVAQAQRAIVFVESKKMARWLCSLLREEADLVHRWNPMYFVGQTGGNRGQSIEGMTWTEHQEPLLQAFRQGTVRLLVSTSVLHEGLDVPACDAIILFDRAWSLTTFVQSRGRARSLHSQYILVCSPQDKHYYEDLLRAEQTMLRLVFERMLCDHAGDIDAAGKVKDALPWIECRQALAALHVSGLVQAVDFEHKRLKDALVPKAVKSVRLQLCFLSQHEDDIINSVELLTLHLQTHLDLNLSPRRVTVTRDSMHSMVANFVVNVATPAALMAACWRTCALPAFSPRGLIQLDEPVISPVSSTSSSAHFNAKDVCFGCTTPNPRTFVTDPQYAMKGLMIKMDIRPERLNLCFLRLEGQNCLLHRVHIEQTGIDDHILLACCDSNVKQPSTISSASGNSLMTEVHVVLSLKRPPTLFFAELPPETRTLESALKLPAERMQWQQGTAESFAAVHPHIGAQNAVCITLFLNDATKGTLLEACQRLGLPVWLGPLTIQPAPWSDLLIPKDVDFDKAYALMCLRSLCFPGLGSLRVFWEQLLSWDAAALHELTLALQGRRFFDSLPLIRPAVTQQTHQSETKRVGLLSNVCRIRMVILTPTRMHCLPPKFMVLNRVTRHFGEAHFVRVQFRDEDLGSKLTGQRSPIVDAEEAHVDWPLRRIESILTQGLVIHGRCFDFLAMSSSQLRDHGCWFVSPFSLSASDSDPSKATMVTADYIRTWIGDFSHIRNVAKYVARLGQSLSASIEGAHVEADAQISMIEDIERNGYCFTDGIGLISHELARVVKAKLDLDYEPCAYQIRFAGFKGVVALDPQSILEGHGQREGLTELPNDGEVKEFDKPDVALKEMVGLKFRPSMLKFESEHRRLEILNVASYIPCHLNRQVIMILSDLGVPDDSFQVLHDEMLLQMARMLLDQEEGRRSLAAHYRGLPRLHFGRLRGGLTTEPLMRAIILAVYNRQLGELLTRTRIFVPRGRILLGTVDELGLLAAGEVFIQCRLVAADQSCCDSYATTNSPGYHVITGDVAVAKNPCMHPGDVRRLRAVVCPQLATCRWDVVVFSQRGPRPVPDMCSGSDLDGDLYFCTWDERLLPPSTDHPMVYDGQADRIVNRPISASDVSRFVVDFIANDALGSIANAHVAHVDQRPLGVKDPLCKQLALIFSQAVDFPKTGCVARLPKEARVHEWPDFMQKPDKVPYVSRKIIGRLFRRCKLLHSHHHPGGPGASIGRPFQFPMTLTDDVKMEVADLYEDYASEIRGLLSLYGIPDEALVLSGCLQDLDSMGKVDLRDTMDIVVAKFRNIQSMSRAQLLDLSEDVPSLARSVYALAYQQEWPIRSFAWLLGDQFPLFTNAIDDEEGEDEGKDVGDILGQQLRERMTAPGWLGERLADWTDRIRLGNIVQQQLSAAFPALRQQPLCLTGSCQSLLFSDFSDVNLATTVRIQWDRMLVALAFKELPSVQTSLLDGSCLKVHFADDDLTVMIASMDSDDQDSDDISMIAANWPAFHVLIQWALNFKLIRHGPHQLSGKLGTTDVARLVARFCRHFQLLPQAPPCDQPSTSTELIVVSHDWRQLAFMKEFDYARQCIAVLRFLQFVAFADGALIVSVFPASEIDRVAVLKDAAFRSLHLLAKTLNLMMLVDPPKAVVQDIDAAQIMAARERTRSRHLQLMRRGGSHHGGYFVSGCSRLLFWTQQSRSDRLRFVPLMRALLRRPQHWDRPCHVPRLLVSDIVEGKNELSTRYARGDFFALMQRQLLTAFKLHSLLLDRATEKCADKGNDAHDDGNDGEGKDCGFGTMKLHIRVGNFYLVSVSRMLLEDYGHGCPYTLLDETLQRTFKRLDNFDVRRAFSAPVPGILLRVPSPDTLPEDNSCGSSAPSPPALADEELLDLHSMDANVSSSKRPLLSHIIGSGAPLRKEGTAGTGLMTAAFEPVVFNHGRLEAFLEELCVSLPPPQSQSSSADDTTDTAADGQHKLTRMMGPSLSLSASLRADELGPLLPGSSASWEGMQQCQLTFDADGRVTSVKTRPLRWLLCDLLPCATTKDDYAESGEEEEATIRFALRSAKVLDVPDRAALGQRVFAKASLVDPVLQQNFCFFSSPSHHSLSSSTSSSSPLPPSTQADAHIGSCQVRPVYLRATVACRAYRLDPDKLQAFFLRNASSCESMYVHPKFIEQLALLVLDVREFHDIDVDTGRFLQHVDKRELDCHLVVPWHRLTDTAFTVDCLTRSAWTLGLVLRHFFRASHN